MECWINMSNVGGSGDPNFRSGIIGTNNDYYVVGASGNQYSTSGVYCFFNGSTITQTSITFIPNQWVHTVLVKKDNTLKMYVNATGSQTVAVSSNAITRIFPGCAASGNAGWNINGFITEFSMVKYGKTESEIINYYNSTRANPQRKTKYTTENTNKIVNVNSSGRIELRDERFLSNSKLSNARVYLYTGNVGSNGSYTWTKPDGCRIVRVICQGGGGGGGAGAGWPGTSSDFRFTGGGGGSGGAISDIILNALTLPSSVVLTAGAGGSKGVFISVGNYSTQNLTNGSGGGTSSFSTYLSATGGNGGIHGKVPVNDGTTGRSSSVTGYRTSSGYGGSSGNCNYTVVAEVGQNISGYFSAPGGGGANGGRTTASTSTNYTRFGAAGGSFSLLGTTVAGGSGGEGYYANQSIPNINAPTPPSGQLFNITGYYLNNVYTSAALPNLICGGGGGGGSWLNSPSSTSKAGNGGSPSYGSGGGGGGAALNISSGQRYGGDGGNGGVGYVLIICY